MKELAHRQGDGCEVTLVWRQDDDVLEVVVEDWRSGERFTVEAPKDKALDVFNHPFAYRPAQAA